MSSTQTEPAAETDDTIEHRFQRLKGEWDKDTAYHSNPAMRAIVALGEPVVPIILRQLEAAGDLGLIWALQEITAENVAPPAIEGGFAKWNVPEQREAWLQWGRTRGFL